MSALNRIKNGECDEADLLEYITDNDIEVAVAAAESTMATEPILAIAARDRDKRVRAAALRNPNIGKNTIEYLVNDLDVEIAEEAKKILEGK